MSYATMDHADWVERQIAAVKRRPPTKKERTKAAERRGWFAAPEQLNDFQRRAFDILGIVGGGIYNAPIAWDSVVWMRDGIIVSWCKGLATYDFNELTMLVLLAHAARIRAQVAPLNPNYLEIALHERRPSTGISRHHPDIAEALRRFDAYVPVDHRVRYSGPAMLWVDDDATR